jgi:hypothetical protein
MFVLPLELLHLWFGVTGQIWESDALSFFHLHEPLYDEASRRIPMGVWQGVTMDYLKYR